jgi:hypothetical protein
MDETQPDESTPEKTVGARGEETPIVTGMEINLGDFTRTQGLLKSLRLTLDNQIVVQVEDLSSGVGEAGRMFKMGELDQPRHDVGRLYGSFGQRISQWESQARNLEQQMKSQTAKNPKSISIDKMNRMKAEQIAVRTRIRTTDVQFRRLHQGLEQAFTNLQRPPVEGASESHCALPAGFLERFQVASMAKRPAVVAKFFETESVLKVSVSRGAQGGYEIKFDPTPPLGRVYFFTEGARVIRLEQLGSVVRILDQASEKESELKLVEFVKQVQSGVWLLKPGSGE